jgi:HAD superfamily hydrolase (TIGR01509 family)
MVNSSGNRGVIFDLDGTIWDSIPYRIKAWQLAFKDFNIDTDPNVIRLMIGYPGSMLIKKMNAKDPAIEKREEKYFSEMLSDVRFFPDVADTFSELKRLGYRIAVVTSSRRAMVKKITIYADAIVTMDDVKNGKPDTESYLKAMAMMNTNPAGTIVVGDIDNDLIPAKILGCTAVLVSHGINKECENKDFKITEIRDLLILIKSLH